MGKTREPSTTSRPKLVRAAAATAPTATPDAATSATTPGATPAATSGDRTQQIAERAYYLAEQRGFAPGGELEDWLAAERAVDAQGGAGPRA
jgi:hypothetical protein